jgi:signal peptide peptidase SppA
MTVLDILNAPWAITPHRLEQIHGIYAAWARGESVDVAAVEAKIGRPLVNDPQGYEVQDGAALIPMRGVMAPRMNLMTQVSGGTSTELFVRDVRTALEDPSVRSLVIMADTPGGAVAGTQRAAAAVMAARGIKPVATYVEGLMASAGVWVGTAADVVMMESATSQAGSVGVVATHVDVSKQEEALGVKTTEIVAGTFKRAASQYGPLTEMGRQVLQNEVDYLYGLFVSDVAAQRGATVEQVLASMADGRMFIGQQAVDAGLVDGIATLEETINILDDRAASFSRTVITVPAVASMDSPPMTPTAEAAAWAADHPEAAAILRAEGAAAECERVTAVRSMTLPGHEALIEQLATDGRTTGPEAAVLVNAAERQRVATAKDQRMTDALPPVAFAPAPTEAEAAPVAPVAVDPIAQGAALGGRARELIVAAEAKGQSLSVLAAMEQARAELTPA